MRRLTTFPCAGETLAATLDMAAGETGLLVVAGGTQTRVGAHRGMATLAATIAAAGHPVLRFERRGVGDSGGTDPGFADSGPDIAAAAAALRAACPGLRRIVGFGLCDGAAALALHYAGAGIDGLVLANPWLVEPAAGLPPPAAIRRRYLDRLTSLSGWRRLLTGGIDYRKAIRGLMAIRRAPPVPPLAATVATRLADGGVPTDIVLATRDATAIAFADAWRGPCFAPVRGADGAHLIEVDSASHSFAGSDDAGRLASLCLAALRRDATEGCG